VVAVGQRVHNCSNLEHARGFVAGIEFSNNSALTVTGCKMTKTGIFIVIVEDANYEGQEEVLPAVDPVTISLEVLRDD
jgi:hypothetical protein